MIVSVPAIEETPWPTLGPQLVKWMEKNLVFGPGDLRGQKLVLTPSRKMLVYRMYEVYPQGHPNAGRRRFRRCMFSVRKGRAKALALDTPVPTPTGWTTMGELQVGDLVFGADGQPYPVTATSEIFRKHICYRVVFNDGTSIVADAGHRWFTKTRRWPKEDEGVKTTEEIKKTLYWHDKKPYSNHRIPVTAPIELPEADLPIHPYVLGVWLGDGATANAMITSGPCDIAEMRRLLRDCGVTSQRYQYADRCGNLWLNGVRPKLRALSLLGNKHVPAQYLRASKEQRLALLQGLMDTDGTANKGDERCAITTKLPHLAAAIVELTRSLGLRPTLTTGRSKLNGVDYGPYFKVAFVPRNDVPVFRLKRKLKTSQRRTRKVSQALARTIVAVERVKSVPVRCISVASPNHLYLAGEGMIPTHNTELTAIIAAAELSLTAPVRCIGFDKKGRPIGGPVNDAYIPMVAVTEEQTDELAYGALRVILELSPIYKQFDIGMQRIMRKDGSGKAVSLANAPDARDGARTTFAVSDETHRWIRPALKASHKTMQANLPKRKKADPWGLEVTTAPCPGEGSIAEDAMDYAKAVIEGRAAAADFFYFHEQADDRYTFGPNNGPEFDMSDGQGGINEKVIREAIIDASGPDAEWSDIDGILAQFRDTGNDRSYLCRVWLNQLVRASEKAFDIMLWDKRTRPNYEVAKGALISLGFDGAVSEDATAIVGTELLTGFQWIVGLWQKPHGAKQWRVPQNEVDDYIDLAMREYDVWKLYADPYFWENTVASWIGKYGAEPYTEQPRVVAWPTNVRGYKMPGAVRCFKYAMDDEPRADLGIAHALTPDQQLATAVEGLPSIPKVSSAMLRLSHSGDPRMRAHIANSQRRFYTLRDAEGEFLWTICKDAPNSPNKIDCAMACILSWQARTDAVAAGLVNVETEQDYKVEFFG